MPTATLTIRAGLSGVSLAFENVKLGAPKPEHPCFRDDMTWFNYRDKVGIQETSHWKGLSSVIATMSHTGRGQTKTFDRLVGPKVAALRLTISRNMREIIKEKGGCEEQTVTVHLTDEEIQDIRERIETCADDQGCTFYEFTDFGFGRYNENHELIWGRG